MVGGDLVIVGEREAAVLADGEEAWQLQAVLPGRREFDRVAAKPGADAANVGFGVEENFRQCRPGQAISAIGDTFGISQTVDAGRALFAEEQGLARFPLGDGGNVEPDLFDVRLNLDQLIQHVLALDSTEVAGEDEKQWLPGPKRRKSDRLVFGSFDFEVRGKVAGFESRRGHAVSIPTINNMITDIPA